MSAILAGVLAGTVLTAVPRGAIAAPDNGAVAAPDNCLSGPQGAAPQGQHWFYRLDSAKRKCWYLRAKGDSAAQSATSQPAAAQSAPAPTAPAAARTPARRPAAPAAQDAHAEWPAPPAANAADTTASVPQQQQTAWPATNAAGPQAAPIITAPTDTAAQQPTTDSRAADASASQPTPSSPPPSAPAVASQASQTAQGDATPDASTTANTSSTKSSEPVFHTLLLVIAGALALAGIIASIVLRLAARQRARRRELHAYQRVNWEPTVASTQPPWRPAPAPAQIEPHEPVAVEPTRDWAARDRNTDVDTNAGADDDADIGQITDLLEQFIRQGPKLDRARPAVDTAHAELQRLARSSARA